MKRFLGYFALFVLVAGIVGGARLLRLNNNRAIYASGKKTLYLYRPVEVKKLSTLLVDSLGVARDKKELIWAAQLLGWNSFNPGRYVIKGGVTYNQFLSKVARGAQDPVTVTILPGRMKGEILSNLEKKFRFDSVAVHSALCDSIFLAKNNVTSRTLIGHLFPQTYKFYWTESPKTVLNKIFNKFETVVQSYQKRLRKLDKSLNDIVTLASIVEWEAGSDTAKRMISGLYWNRLQRGMLLQADPTIIYAIGERRRLVFEDYEMQHPYNTYIHPGLPPGPVTNPDLNSIKAALYPAEHDYIYMVAKPDGGHAFSKTYAQHQRKAEEWRQWLQKQHEIKRNRESNS